MSFFAKVTGMKIGELKIGEKLFAGFMILAVLVAITGYIGYSSVKNVGAAGNMIVDEKAPLAQGSLKIAVIATAMRDAMGEYMLSDDPSELDDIRDEFGELTADFGMWHSAMTYGTDSDQFKGSDAGKRWINTGRGNTEIVAVTPGSEPALLLREADANFVEFEKTAEELMDTHDQSLELEPKAGEKMEEMDAEGGVMLEIAAEKSFSNDDMNLIWEQVMTVNDFLITGSQDEIDAFQETSSQVEALSNYPAIETEHKRVVQLGEETINLGLTAQVAQANAEEKMEEMDAEATTLIAKAQANGFTAAEMNLLWEQIMTVNDYLITGSQDEIDAFEEAKDEIEALTNYAVIRGDHRAVVQLGEETINYGKDAENALKASEEKMEEMDAAGVLMLERATEKSFSNDDMNLVWEQIMTVNDFLITGSQDEIDGFEEAKDEIEVLTNYAAIEASHKEVIRLGQQTIDLRREYLDSLAQEKALMEVVDELSLQVDDSMSSVEASVNADMSSSILAARATQARSTTMNIFTMAVAIILAIVIGQMLSRNITVPIKKLVSDAEIIAEGDLGHRIESSVSKDEIGELTNSIRQMVENTAGPVRKLGIASKAMAQGDLTVDLDIESKGDISELIDAFKEMADSLHNLVAQVQSSSGTVAISSNDLASMTEEMNASAEQVSSTVQQMANGAQNQSEQTQKVNTGMQNLAELVSQVTKNSQEANNISGKANETAQHGGNVIKESANVVKELNERSQQIVEIVNVITSIADQTNLLALNAAIEAARAGEHGRGFAVVAEEVRKLAEESAKAADKIAELIKGIQGETTKATESMDTALGSLDEIVKSVNDTAENVQKITVAMNEQSSEVEKVVSASGEIAAAAEEAAASSEEVSSATEEQTASMQQMSSSAQQLSRLAVGLQDSVARFKLKENGTRIDQRIAQTQKSTTKPKVKIGKMDVMDKGGDGKGHIESDSFVDDAMEV
jgi:methyl-accepting chemotaxis protein